MKRARPRGAAPGESGLPNRAINATPSGPFANLGRRIVLTYSYLGWRTVVWRALTFPLRFTPLRHRLRLGSIIEAQQRVAESWYKARGRPVTIVIPTYGDPCHTADVVRSVRRTTDRARVQIVVTDDASHATDLAALRAIGDIDELILCERNTGFAGNVNRGLAVADPLHDVVVLNSDVIARDHWLECLQHAAYTADDIGIVGPKLLYPDGRIQHAGVHRNLGAPVWFDHRFRFKPADHGPANVTGPVLAVTGACMYVRRTLLDTVGPLDERYAMAYEDVDWCLRAWQAGFRVLYHPPATLDHVESPTRGRAFGERERASQEAFWERWGDFFDGRGTRVQTATGGLRVIYVTEGTGVGGGHRDVFEHLNRLHARGHDARLFTLGNEPQWFDLRAPVVTFSTYAELTVALAQEDAIKVATWWTTAEPVWCASVVKGIPVFFVQDIETSYYPDDERTRHVVLAGYRQEFHYMTISRWNADRLRELRLECTLVPPGIDLGRFRPLPGVERGEDMLLALGRTNPLKNLQLTVDAWKMLPEPHPQLFLFGIEPELGAIHGARYVELPSDDEVNELYSEAAVFIQTSSHEGFCLPALEAMASGTAVVCTDAHGNRDFCVDGDNCLMPAPTARAVSTAIARLLADPDLRARLGRAGRRTAQDYSWERRIDELEGFLWGVAGSPRVPSTTTHSSREEPEVQQGQRALAAITALLRYAGPRG